MKPSSWGRPEARATTARGGVAGVGHGDDDVGLDGRLAPQDLPHASAGDLEHGPGHPRIRAGEVDVLKDAERMPLRLDGHPRLESAVDERHDLTGLDVTQVPRADQVKRAGFRGDAVRTASRRLVLDDADRERAQAGRIPERDDRLIGHDHRRERTPELRQDLGGRILDPVRRMGRQQRGDDLRVRRRAERDVPAAELGVELDRVDQVAVVRERQRTTVVTDDRLGVLPLRGAGRRVPDVTDRHVADERPELVLVEHLADEALVADRHQAAPARGGRDPRRLLAAVLQREESEIREPRDVVLRRKDAENPTFVPRSVAVIREVSHTRKASLPRLAAGRVTHEISSASPRSRASRSPETGRFHRSAPATTDRVSPPTRPIACARTSPAAANASSEAAETTNA